MATYHAAIVSDTHCMSRYGLVPPDFRFGVKAQPTAHLQAHLWSCWERFCATCPQLDLLILNGDLYDGENPSRRDAMTALTDDLLVQGDAAVVTLSMLIEATKPAQIISTRGTGWHEGKYYETAERIAHELGCVQSAPHRHTAFVWDVTWRGLHLNITHHQTTGAIYRGTLADRSTLFASAAEAQGKMPATDVLIRSHLHSKYIGRSHQHWFVSTPGWTAVNPHAMKQMGYERAALLSDVGAIVLTTDGGGNIGFKEFAYPVYRVEPREVGGGAVEITRPARTDHAHRGADGRAGRQRRSARRAH